MKSKRTNLTLLLWFLGLLVACGLVAIAPSPLEWRAGYRDVLQIELPQGVTCVMQRVDASGRERTTYCYHALLRGPAEALVTCVGRLGLKEEPPAACRDARALAMRAGNPKWWNPPSSEGRTDYRVFQRTSGARDAGGGRFCRTQAELAGDRLYLVQFGDIKTLDEVVRKRGWFGWPDPKTDVPPAAGSGR